MSLTKTSITSLFLLLPIFIFAQNTSIRPLNIDSIYSLKYSDHPDIIELSAIQTDPSFIKDKNYRIRVRVNHQILNDVEDYIILEKRKMLSESSKTKDLTARLDLEEKINQHISKAFLDADIVNHNVSRLIWNQYLEKPKFKLLPAKNSATAMAYFNQSKRINFLSNVNIEGWDSIGSIRTSLFTAYIANLQFSINTMISRVTPQKLDESLRNKYDSIGLRKALINVDSINSLNSTLYKTISGGGEVSLGLKLPIVSWNIARYLSRPSANLELGNFTGFDLPVAGRYIGENDLILNNILQLRTNILCPFKVVDDNEQLVSNTQDNFNGVTVNISYNQVMGTSNFYEALHIKPKSFGYYSASFGITVQKFTLIYTFMGFSEKQLDKANYNRLQLIINTGFNKGR